jgi:DNA-binding GntR family transcriptional regulator
MKLRPGARSDLPQDHIGRPIIVRCIPTAPVRRAALTRDAGAALAVSEHEGMLNALQRRDASGLAHILRTRLRRKRDEVVQAGFAEPGRAGS